MSMHLLFAFLFLGASGITAASQTPVRNSTVTGLARQAAGQNEYANPMVRLDPSSLRHFDSALNSVSKQARVAIVCEGQPPRLELTDAEVRRIAERMDLAGMPLGKAVEQVAAAFDYESARTGAAMFVLTKRYSDPNDLPDVSFEGAAVSLENIMRATRNFVPAISKVQAIRTLLFSSSDEQRERLPGAYLSRTFSRLSVKRRGSLHAASYSPLADSRVLAGWIGG